MFNKVNLTTPSSGASRHLLPQGEGTANVVRATLRCRPLLFLIGLFLFLSGCGFHLRGATELAPPLHSMYLQIADPYGPIARSLKDSLEMSHVELTDSPLNAKTILHIQNVSTSQNLLSVNGNQQTRQYNLGLTVNFVVTDAAGNILLGPRVATETRVITIQSSQILAGSNEASNLYKLMYQAVVVDIMYQLSSYKEVNPTKKPT